MEATGVTQAAGKFQDAQLEAQAAEPLVSTSLICKLMLLLFLQHR